tara:strand:+ start:342 stop:920 length:579 start_codon:yes stop_codon:yes gene_type:complete
MPVSLSKGQSVSLTKDNPSLSKVFAGLGWDQRDTDGAEFDLDASAFLIGEDGKVFEQPGAVGFFNPQAAGGAVAYGGDNRTGEGDGDDEVVNVDLQSLPEAVQKVVITVTIHEAEKRNQNFGGIENSFVRVVNEANGEELVRYDLREDYDIETAMIMGEFYRHDGGWKFRAIGQGFNDGLEGLANKFGMQVG